MDLSREKWDIPLSFRKANYIYLSGGPSCHSTPLEVRTACRYLLFSPTCELCGENPVVRLGGKHLYPRRCLSGSNL